MHNVLNGPNNLKIKKCVSPKDASLSNLNKPSQYNFLHLPTFFMQPSFLYLPKIPFSHLTHSTNSDCVKNPINKGFF